MIEVKDGLDITTYEYNAIGELVKTTLPNGTITTQTYDAANRLTVLETITENQVKLTSIEYSYDNRDLITKEVSYIDGLTTMKTYTYDEEEQLIHSTHVSAPGDQTTVAVFSQGKETSYDYTYDANGNKIAVFETTNGKITGKQFKFDAADKLLDVEGDMNTNYTYDDAGNVTKKVYKTGLIEDLKYDATGQLIQVQNNRGQTITYSYDGFGNRTSKTEKIDIASSKENNGFLGFLKQEQYNEDYSMELDSQTTVEQLQNLKENLRDYQSTYGTSDYCPVSSDDAPKQTQKTLQYVNDINAEYTQVLQVQSDNYQPRETYVYGVQRISNEQNNSKTFYQYDAKGSVIGQESNKKEDALFFKVRYNDFGQPHRKLDNEFGYNAEAHDYNGTQYLRARYYDTKNGRFDQRDSYMGEHGVPLSENRYTYVWNNPSKYIDPSGNALEIDGASPELNGAVNRDLQYYQMYLDGLITLQEFKDKVGHNWWKFNIDNPDDQQDQAAAEEAWGRAGSTEEAINKAEAARAAREAAKKKEVEDIRNELVNQRNINIPDLSGLSLDEQLRILREIKKICDEIEGKYGKWDNSARDEAQKEADKIVKDVNKKVGDDGLGVGWEDYQNSMPGYPGYTRIPSATILDCNGEPVKVFDGTGVVVGVLFLVVAAILVVAGLVTGGTAWVPAYGAAAAGVIFIIGGTPYGAHDVMAAGGDCEEECVSQGTSVDIHGIDSWLPRTLSEQLAILEVMSNPAGGVVIPTPKTTEIRWLKSEGWMKMRYPVRGSSSNGVIEVHYQYNPKKGCVDDLKIKKNSIDGGITY